MAEGAGHADNVGARLLAPHRAASSQLKFGRTSAPLWPQTWQVNSGSKMGQPDVIRPAADSGPMAAPTIREIDQPTPNASGAHLSKGNLFVAGSFGHAPLKRAQAKSSSSGFSSHRSICVAATVVLAAED
jgi:hypothetical protein